MRSNYQFHPLAIFGFDHPVIARYNLDNSILGIYLKGRKMAKKMFLWIALVLITVSLVGCQTVRGLGRDVEWIGGKTTEAAGGE